MALLDAWWPASPPLRPDEHVLCRWAANRKQGRRAVGGALFLTDARLVFDVNVLERYLGGQRWQCERADVVSVVVARKTGTPFDGGLRDRLAVRLRDGRTELFVVNGLPRVLETLRAHLAV